MNFSHFNKIIFASIFLCGWVFSAFDTLAGPRPRKNGIYAGERQQARIIRRVYHYQMKRHPGVKWRIQDVALDFNRDVLRDSRSTIYNQGDYLVSLIQSFGFGDFYVVKALAKIERLKGTSYAREETKLLIDHLCELHGLSPLSFEISDKDVDQILQLSRRNEFVLPEANADMEFIRLTAREDVVDHLILRLDTLLYENGLSWADVGVASESDIIDLLRDGYASKAVLELKEIESVFEDIIKTSPVTLDESFIRNDLSDFLKQNVAAENLRVFVNERAKAFLYWRGLSQKPDEFFMVEVSDEEVVFKRNVNTKKGNRRK